MTIILPRLFFSTLRGTFAMFLVLLSVAAYAQTEEDEWMRAERPEHVYQYAEGGVRRLPSRIGSRQSASLTSTGSPRVPVVLVQFADRPFYAAGQTEEEIRLHYELFFNGEENAEVKAATGSRGSIRTYFHDQSLGQFSPKFELIGPVTLCKGYAAYGRNEGRMMDVGIGDFYSEALQLSVQELNVDWTQFDNDANGTVDMVFFIHAGWGENTVQEVDEDAIWAKESATPMTVSCPESSLEVVFSCYGVCAEANVKSMKQLREKDSQDEKFANGYNTANLCMDGIGVCVHELSHALGLPDFYDTRNVAFGMDTWSVMDYGVYLNKGYNPCGYTAYERDFMGWQPLVELCDTCVLDIACFADGGCGYIVRNTANEDEYYVLENRQPKGWDDKLKDIGRGLMVTHVDYQPSLWNGNRVNIDPNHQHMTIIAANNNYNGVNVAASAAEWRANLSGNLFPYTQPCQSLTDTTSPDAKAFSGGHMNRPIYDITLNADSTVTVYFLKSRAEQEKDFNTSLQAIDSKDFIDIYAMNGQHICRCRRDELHRHTFRRGIYFVKFPGGKVRKVMLK